MKIKFYLLIISGLFANVTFAESNLPDSIGLDEVVVTGSKTGISRKIIPLSVTQINQKEIENSGQMNILTALNQYSPGVFVTERNILGFGVSTGGSGAISMRGIGGSPNTGILVLIDGHPQYQGLFGHPLADAYVSSDVSKVEMIHGPGSILYGSNAMGGVVNIITKKQKTDGWNSSLGATYGSYNTQKYSGTTGFRKNGFSVFASANHSSTDGIRENTDFKITNAYLKTGYDFNDRYSVTIDADIAKYDGNDNGKTTNPMPFNIDILRGKAALSFDNKNKLTEGSLKLYHNFGEHFLSDGFHSTDYNSGLMFYQSAKLFEGNLITIGTDMKNYGGKANRGVNKDTLLSVRETGVYVYVRQNVLEKWTLTAGLRSEFHSNYDPELIPMVGLNYNVAENTTIKANFSKGFRSPTVMEMYLYAPNPSLKPERLYNYELGVMQSLCNNRIDLEVNAFYIQADNLIQVVGGPIPQRQNTGKLTNYGVEFSSKYRVSDNLYVHANYSYLHTSKATLAAPAHQFNVGGNYRYKIWSTNLSLQQINGLYSNVLPEKIQNYTLLNLRIAVQPLKHLEVFVMGNNLLNSKYEINDGYPMPGINFHGGVKYSF